MGWRALLPGTTRAEALPVLRRALSEAGIGSGAAEARLLLAAALGVAPIALVTRPDEALGPGGAARLDALARRRLLREPLGRILGEREFWGLPFRLSPGTLEPRPDTETVVEAALATVPDRSRPLRLLDLGTGSGCLLVALLSELPQARGVGVDRSWDALGTAARNAARNGVAARAGFVRGDWAEAVGGPVDLVVANPPYIPGPEIPGLAPEVSRYDPAAALDGGPDGLDGYRAILPDLSRLLAPGGRAVLEIGHDQAAAVTALAHPHGWEIDRVVPDLGGRSRALVFRRGRRETSPDGG